jgi:hypothetical protein
MWNMACASTSGFQGERKKIKKTKIIIIIIIITTKYGQ